MKRKFSSVFMFLAVLFLFEIAGFSAGLQPADSAQDVQPAASRKTASDFQLTGLNGEAIELGSFRGKVVLLDFWATWCPPCRAEIPHFNELYSAYKGQGFELIGLSVGEDPEVVRSFVAANDMRYPVAISNEKVEQAYGGIRGIPTTFLIDKKGRIAQKYVGYHEKAVFEGAIRKLLAE
ncbi:MAG: TlpA family protein disulfide reductase [Candidatus Omnitrophica bacterium]|nr:TlpA family protein disulfide reductase [Candidatus Omnitrophota bacterium]